MLNGKCDVNRRSALGDLSGVVDDQRLSSYVID
jgi:hypothetical protein